MPATGIEVAFGGYVRKNGTIVTNNAPNTFLAPGVNVFDRIRFDTTDAQSIIILARYRDDFSGTYQPSSKLTDFTSFQARVSYTNGSVAIDVAGMAPDSYYVQSEEDENGSLYSLYPVKLIIPLSGIITYVTVDYLGEISAAMSVVNSPESLNQFGFLALNRNNPAYQMQISKVARNFGLVLDSLGAWDILVTPESILTRDEFGAVSFGGSRFSRDAIDTDDRFIMGIGIPVINSDNDVIRFDQTSIPEQVRNYISIFPLPGNASIWIIRLQPQFKAYLASLRAIDGAGTNNSGCYIDIPVYARASTSLAEGTANVRVFADVGCIFDYDMCEFYWNLGTALEPEGFAGVSNTIKLLFEELVDCDAPTNIIDSGGMRLVDISNTFILKIEDIPTLNNGNSLLIIKRDASQSDVISVVPAVPFRINNSKRVTGIPDPFRPWEYQCSFLSVAEVTKANKSVLYFNPDDLSVFTTDIVQMVAITSDPNSRWMLVQPRFEFPPTDEFGNSFPVEEVIGSIGFQFKDWDQKLDKTKDEFVILTSTFRVPIQAQNINLRIPVKVRYLYSEDRRVLNGGLL
jgi:hypothetical protein